MTPDRTARSGLRDLRQALANPDLWLYLAWQDIRLRYRRSVIGPLWITLSMAIFCLSLGVVYSQLFRTEMTHYLPFLATGFVLWGLVSGLVGEFPNIFVDNAAYIKEIRINPLAILLRAMTRHVIIFFHNALIIVAVFLWFGLQPGPMALLAIPGTILVLLNIFAAGVLLSLFGARFRDLAPIVQSLVQVLFFITPLTWLPRLVPADSWIVRANPMGYYLDITRAPLLGQQPEAVSWLVSLATLALLAVLAAGLYRAKAGRIPFWV